MYKMPKVTRKTLKRALSFSLVLILVVMTAIPAGAATVSDIQPETIAPEPVAPAEKVAGVYTDEIIERLGLEKEVPSNYQNRPNPYGFNGTFSVLHFPELVVDSKTSSNTRRVNIYDVDKDTDAAKKRGLYSMDSGELLRNEQLLSSRDAQISSSTGSLVLENTNMVALDAMGTGKKNWIAAVYWDGNSLKLQAVPAEKADEIGNFSNSNALSISYTWDIDLSNEYISPWERKGYFPITAGDFDGDGIDEVAVTYFSDHSGTAFLQVSIFKISQDNNGKVHYTNVAGESDLSSGYTRYSSSAKGRSKVLELPVVHLQSGDLTGDGMDELIITTSENKGTHARTPYNGASRVFIFQGPVQIDDNKYAELAMNFSSNLYTNNGKGDCTEIMSNAASAVGDIDGDGISELVVAGNMHNSPENNTTSWALAKEKNLITYIKYDGKYFRIAAEKGVAQIVERSRELNDSSLFEGTNDKWGIYDDDKISEPVALSVFKADGEGKPALIFLEGTILELKKGSGIASKGDRGPLPSYATISLNEKFEKIYTVPLNYGKSTSNIWISQVVTGNFSKDPLNRESVIFTFGMKKSGEDCYWMDLYSVKKDGSNFSYTFSKNIVNGKKSSEMFTSIVAPDVDDDAMLLQYLPDQNSYAFSDPEIIAVLQAPPFFNELYDNDEDTMGSTAVGSSQSAGVSTGSGFGVNGALTFGYSNEVSFFGVTLMEVNTGLSVTGEVMDETTSGKTQTFNCSDEADSDAVVLTLIPYVIYHYNQWVPPYVLPAKSEYNAYVSRYNEVKKQIDQLVNSGVSISDPKLINLDTELTSLANLINSADAIIAEGVYTYGQTVPGSWSPFEVKVPEMPVKTALLVDEYDAIAKETNAFSPIRGTVLQNVKGDPATYPKDTDVIFTKYDVDSSWLALNDAVISTQTFSMEDSYESLHSWNVNSTFNLEGGALGITAGFEMGGQGGLSHSQTSSSETEYSGTVMKLPVGMKDQYGFEWRLGTWDAELDGKGFPVVGYMVRNVRAPLLPPKNLNIDGTTLNSVVLSWEKDFRQGSKYKLYRTEEGKTDSAIPIKVLDGDILTYTDMGLKTNTSYTYTITSWDEAKNIESGRSQSVEAITVDSGYAPVFAKHPGEKGVIKAQTGESADLSVVVTPVNTSSELSYQWRVREVTEKNGVKTYGKWKDIDGATSSTFTLQNISPEMDAYLYQCKASQVINGVERAAYSNPAMLIVDPFTVTYKAGSNGSLQGYGYWAGSEEILFESDAAMANQLKREVPFNSGATMTERVNVVMRAAPGNGFIASEWKINGVVQKDETGKNITGNELRLPALTGNVNVEVKFLMGSYKLNYQAEGNGSVSAVYNDSGNPVTAGASVLEGKSIKFNAVPDDGYVIKQWTVNGEVLFNDDATVYTGATYIIPSMMSDTSVVAAFEPAEQFKITHSEITTSGNRAVDSSISISGDAYDDVAGTAEKGSSITFTAHPSDSSTVQEWWQYDENGTETDASGRAYRVVAGAAGSYTVNNLQQDLEITAVFYDLNENLLPPVDIDTNNAFITIEDQAVLSVEKIDEILASDAKYLIISATDGTLALDRNALMNIAFQAEQEAIVSIKNTPKELSAQISRFGIEKLPFYEFSITVDGNPVSNLGDGMVTFAVPYSLPSWASADTVMVAHASDGSVNGVPNSRFKDGMVCFQTNCIYDFTIFGNADLVSSIAGGWEGLTINADTIKCWFDAVMAGDITGDTTVTVQMLVTALAKIYGIENVEAYIEAYRLKLQQEQQLLPEEQAADMSNLDPAMLDPFVQWAIETGILVPGSDGTYAPTDPLSQEEILVILQNYAEYAGIEPSEELAPSEPAPEPTPESLPEPDSTLTPGSEPASTPTPEQTPAPAPAPEQTPSPGQTPSPAPAPGQTPAPGSSPAPAQEPAAGSTPASDPATTSESAPPSAPGPTQTTEGANSSGTMTVSELTPTLNGLVDQKYGY